jgi:hypothetical protein
MEGREMAYNPTTWGSNDVITKDRLNKMEQGIVSASKLSGTDIDTDKDWNGKNITNVGTLSANLLILSESPFTIVPDPTKNAKYLMKSDDVETAGTKFSSWTLAKSLPPLPASVSGTENSVYVSYQHRSSGPYTTRTRIYVNGVAVGTERSHGSTSYTTWDEVITGLKAGDIIQIYTRAAGEAYRAYVRNLRVYGGTFQSIPMTPGIW